MKNIMKLALLSTVSLLLPFYATASEGDYAKDDPTLNTSGGVKCESNCFVKAIFEVEPAIQTQILLLNMTYENDAIPPGLSEDVEGGVKKTPYEKELGTLQAIFDKSEALKKDTGADGTIDFNSFASDMNAYKSGGQKEASLFKGFDYINSYDDLMASAKVAKENNDIGSIYAAYKDYNLGFYKESIINQMKAELSNMDETQYAASVVVMEESGVDFESKGSFPDTIFGNILEKILGKYQEYGKYASSATKNNGVLGYVIPFDKKYADIDVFSTLAPEYALFKFNLAEATSKDNGIDWMMGVISDNMFEDGKVDGNNLASKKYNMFQSQALAANFANSIAIRELTQRYINSKDDVSALGSEAGNDRANWYALNVLTTGLIKVLGWQAVLDAGNLEYESSFRIKTLSKKDKGDSK